MMRLRHMVRIGPSPLEARRLEPDAVVTFAPMEALDDGLGGLDTSELRPLSAVASGSYNYFAEGDLLLAKVTPCFENGKKALATGLSNGCGYATSEVHVLRPDPKRIDARFLLYLLSSEDFRAEGMASMTGAGGLRRVSGNGVLNYRPLVNNLDTQKTIADFLDRETARIDQLIEKKERLTKLIQEKLSAVVEDVLFGPVDLGSWKASRLKYLAKSISKGTTPSTIGAEFVDEGVRFVRAENIWHGVVLGEPATFVSEETHATLARSALQVNDVLVVIAGATTGKTAVLGEGQTPANTNQAVSFVRLWKPELAHIVSEAIKCPRVQHQIALTSVQAAQPNLAMEDLGNLFVPLPPNDEVAATLALLSQHRDQYRSALSAIKVSIERLREFRSALITSAVTGQIDVTTWGKQGSTDRRLDQIEEEMKVG